MIMTTTPSALTDPPRADGSNIAAQRGSRPAHPDDLAFHRLGRLTEPHRWWRPVALLVTIPVGYLALVLLPLILLVVWGMSDPRVVDEMNRISNGENLNDPYVLAAMLFMIALLLPASLLAVRLVGRRPAGTVLSVAGRLRWRLLGRAAVISAVFMIIALAVTLLVDPPPAYASGSVHRWPLIALLLVLAVVPWQAAAEEVLFRGVLMQAVGAWLRHPVWAIVLPAPLFVLGHDYNAYGLADIAVFALVAGYLTWRTGGLEAAIGLHVVNNLVAISAAVLTGSDLYATDVSVGAAALSVVVTVAAATVILLLHRRDEQTQPGATSPV